MTQSQCPKCGSPIQYEDGDKSVLCQHCQQVTVLRIDDEMGMLGHAKQVMELALCGGVTRNSRDGSILDEKFLQGKRVVRMNWRGNTLFLTVEW